MAAQNRDPRSHCRASLLTVRRLTLALVLFASQGFIHDPSAGSSYVRWQRHPTKAPDYGPARLFASAITDSLNDRVILFGGLDQAVGCASNDVFELSLSGLPVWRPLHVEGERPPARWRHTAIYDPTADKMIVFGGRRDCGGVLVNDSWALSLSSTPPRWDKLAAPGPPSPREFHSAVFDPIRRRMVVYGGTTANGYPDGECWSLDLSSTAWTRTTTYDTPQARSKHIAVYDPYHDRMIVHGGATVVMDPEVFGGQCGQFADVWELSFPSNQWRRPEFASAESPPRLYDTDAIVQDQSSGRIWLFFRDGELWSMTEDTPTSVLASLVTSEVVGRRPRLMWSVSSDAECRIERAVR